MHLYCHIIVLNLICCHRTRSHLDYYSLEACTFEILYLSFLLYCSELLTGVVPYTDLRAEAQVSFLNCIFIFRGGRAYN
jgi:hypothetical protein